MSTLVLLAKFALMLAVGTLFLRFLTLLPEYLLLRYTKPIPKNPFHKELKEMFPELDAPEE